MIRALLVLAFGPPTAVPVDDDDTVDAAAPIDDGQDAPAPVDDTVDAVPPSDDATGTVDVPPPTAPATGGTTVAPPWQSSAAPGKPKVAPSEQAIERDSTVPLELRAQTRRQRWQRPGSKQRFAFEFKIGPYLPEVDNAYDGPGFGPYATIFGRTNSRGEAVKKPRPGVMPVLAFEWQFIYLAGPLAIGPQIGFFRDRADALVAEPMGDENIRSSADSTTFGMVPLTAMLTYRFELVADFYKVPLVPYAKAGITYAFWWIKDGTGKVAINEAGKKGRGGVLGWQINPGIMLRLDALEPSASKKLDQSTGINHAYLFGEFQLTRLRNFGVGNSIDLGDKTFLAGIAIEF